MKPIILVVLGTAFGLLLFNNHHKQVQKQQSKTAKQVVFKKRK